MEIYQEIKVTIHNPPIRNSGGRTARSNEQKAKSFAEYLENTLQSNEGDNLEEWDDM